MILKHMISTTHFQQLYFVKKSLLSSTSTRTESSRAAMAGWKPLSWTPLVKRRGPFPLKFAAILAGLPRPGHHCAARVKRLKCLPQSYLESSKSFPVHATNIIHNGCQQQMGSPP